MNSVVIPTRNAGERFRETLEAIQAQVDSTAELVVVDSGSSDGTPELARRFGARTICISPESFNHGETRNLGIQEASGELCVLLVQDAVPAQQTWLANLIAPFSDPRVVGVTGRQVPRPDADPIGRWEVEWGNRFLGEKLVVQEVVNCDDFLALDYEQRLRIAWFNNVCSAVRREFWERHPFRSVPFAEDVDWSLRALAAGYRIVYNPFASVIHSHSRPAAYNLRRHYVAAKIMRKLLQAPSADRVAGSDIEFFSQVGDLCAEVESMLARPAGDSDEEFAVFCGPARGTWRSVLAASGLRRLQPNYEGNPLREHFYSLLDELRIEEACSEPGVRNHILIQALARSIGISTASYHNWCEANGCLSAEMQRLEATWSAGV